MNRRLLAFTRPLCILFPSSVALAPFAIPRCNIRLKTDLGAKVLAATSPFQPSSMLPATTFVVMKPMLSKFGVEYGAGKECGALNYCYGWLQNLKYRVGLGRVPPFFYTGYVRDSDGQPHGYGMLSSLHHPGFLGFSAYLQGEFRAGVTHGQGVQMLFHSYGLINTTEGQFVGGVSHGYCRIVDEFFFDGVYEGFMEKGDLHGSGTMICSDGSRQSGVWDKGKLQGDGCPSRHAASGCAPADLPPLKKVKEVGSPQKPVLACRNHFAWPQPNPDFYLSQLPFLWPASSCGGKYSGLVLRDGGHCQEHGPGDRTFDDGERHEGEFSNGNLNGHGRHERTAQRLSRSCIVTVGRCIYASGGVYVGSWVAGRRSGVGMYTGCLQDGDYPYYFGEWRSDLPHGHGARVSLDGSQYVGEFKDGYPDGQGTLTHPDGRMECGTWRQGVL